MLVDGKCDYLVLSYFIVVWYRSTVGVTTVHMFRTEIIISTVDELVLCLVQNLKLGSVGRVDTLPIYDMLINRKYNYSNRPKLYSRY